MAVVAARLGQSELIPSAIRHLAGRGDAAAASELLRSAAPADSRWQARARIEAALELSDATVARNELLRYREADFEVDPEVAARAHLRAGDVARAEETMAAAEAAGSGCDCDALRFDLALAKADYHAAASRVGIFENEFATALQRYVDIVRRAPALAFQPSLLLATAVVLVLALMIVSIPGLVLVPVHYRGLGRRLHGNPPPPLLAGVGLRHAWIGAAAVLLVPVLVGVVMVPGEIAWLFTDDGGMPLWRYDEELYSTLATLLVLLPLAWRLGREQWFGARADVAGQVAAVLLAWAAAFAVAWASALWHQSMGHGDTSTEHTKLLDGMIQDGLRMQGLAATLLFIAVLVPLLEELVFRGLLLGGMAKHIGFGWANLTQALAFALVHDDTPRFASYFVLALLAGWLVRRRGTLWPAVALHGIHNAQVTLLRWAL